ncbi:MAG: hypothetical protein PHI05_04575 [Bacilli bacterium]|nr:hypothetical protein [Bacilli bacterium]
MKKVLISTAVFFTLINNVQAIEINSKHAVLYNLNENKIIFEKNKDSITSIASLTKIMTTLVAVENIKDINDKIVIDDTMFEGLYEADAAVIGLTNGQVVTYEDLLYGTLISSGADATRALTINIAGSEENFVNLMNNKAIALGLTKTKFTNATGLDEVGQTSTVDEVAKLLIYALKNEKFKKIFNAQSYSFSDQTKTLYSTLEISSVLYNLDTSNIIGSKTGYTDEAGKCLASVAYDKENDITYLLVTTKATISSDYAYHIMDAIDVYDYYFTNYKYYNLVNKGEELIKLDTKYSKVKSVTYSAKNDIKLYSDNTFNKNNIQLSYNGKTKLTPNLKKGEKVGTVDVIYNNEIIDIIDITIDERIPFSLIEFLKSNIHYIIVISGLLLIIVFKVFK